MFASAGETVRGAQSQPLRIALFSGNYNMVRDGANQALNRLVRRLIEHGIVVRVYSPTVPAPAFAPAGTLVSAPSLAMPLRPEYRLALGLSRRLRRDLAAFAPDIVHVSAPDPLGFAAQRWAREHGVEVVASLHTRFETYPEHYGLGALRPIMEMLLRRFYSHAETVLAPTPDTARELRKSGWARDVRLWSRGVDRSIFTPVRRSEDWRLAHGYAPEDAVPLFFGRLVREKGLELFARGMAALRARGLPVRPLIVGDGPARGWFAERLPNAVFAGHLSGAALGVAVASADILVNPSRTEAFGNVTLEAMAAGLVPVCADVASARQLVTHAREGLLVVRDDPEDYAAAVAELASRPKLRATLAAAAVIRSRAFDWDRTLDAVIDCYREALGRRAQDADGEPAAAKAAIAA